MAKSNIVLIGMPGAGKSTIGRRLAELFSFSFIETDAVIESKLGRKLQSIVNEEGYLALRAIEERCLVSIEAKQAIISTGGSAVYSDHAMRHLSQSGLLVYLAISYETMLERIGDHSKRGLAKPKDQSVAELYLERAPLYQAHCDIQIDCDSLSIEQVCKQLELESIQKKMHDDGENTRGRYDRKY